jgi:hypothetical protein
MGVITPHTVSHRYYSCPKKNERHTWTNQLSLDLEATTSTTESYHQAIKKLTPATTYQTKLHHQRPFFFKRRSSFRKQHHLHQLQPPTISSSSSPSTTSWILSDVGVAVLLLLTRRMAVFIIRLTPTSIIRCVSSG